MPPKTRPSVNKRNREQARRDRQAEKAARRSERATQRKERGDLAPGEDPDLIGIVPGPQPITDDDSTPPAPDHDSGGGD
jgi:hypothetical protein